MAEEKANNDLQNTTHTKNTKIEQHESHQKTGGELRCSGRAGIKKKLTGKDIYSVTIPMI